jgi:hypothetical protein
MPGLVRHHVFLSGPGKQDVDGRDEPGHDDVEVSANENAPAPALPSLLLGSPISLKRASCAHSSVTLK